VRERWRVPIAFSASGFRSIPPDEDTRQGTEKNRELDAERWRRGSEIKADAKKAKDKKEGRKEAVRGEGGENAGEASNARSTERRRRSAT